MTITLQDGLRVQILPSFKYLATCQKHQNAAFIKDQGLLVVWADSPSEVISQAKHIERQMMHVFARGLDPYDEKSQEKESHAVHVTEKPLDSDKIAREDGLLEAPRKIVLNQAVLCAITLILIIAALGSGWRQLAIEIKVDRNWMRLAFVLVMPLQIWLALVCLCYEICSKAFLITIFLHAVLYAVRCRLLRSACRPIEANVREFKIFLGNSTASTRTRNTAPCDYPMSCIQRRPLLGH